MSGGARPDIVIVDGRVYTRIEAKRLAVGDQFVEQGSLDDALEHGWAWTVVEHVFTGRGDYSTIIYSDETTWTERYEPNEPVWLVTTEEGPMAEQATPEQAMAEKRAILHRIAVEEADSGTLSEDEERERSEWPR